MSLLVLFRRVGGTVQTQGIDAAVNNSPTLSRINRLSQRLNADAAFAVSARALAGLLRVSQSFSVAVKALNAKLAVTVTLSTAFRALSAKLSASLSLSASILTGTGWVKAIAVDATLAVSDWVKAVYRARVIPAYDRLRLKWDSGLNSLRYSALLKAPTSELLRKTLEATSAFTANLRKRVNKQMAVALSLAVAFAKRMRVAFAQGLTLSTSLTRTAIIVAKQYLQQMAVTITNLLSITWMRGRLLSAAVSLSASIGTNFIELIRGLAKSVVSRIAYIVSAVNRANKASTTVEKVVKARGRAEKES